jgi:hypothetical protein
VKITVAALLFVASPSVYAQSLHVERIEITNQGIYEIEAQRIIGDKDLAGSHGNVVTKLRRIRTTTIIPARLCISFGLEYRIIGKPNGIEVPITMAIRLPKRGLYDPGTKRIFHRYETVVDRTIGDGHFRSYTLDKEWEVVSGVWTLEFWYEDRKLVEQSFTLIETPRDPQAECGGILVSSISTPRLRGESLRLQRELGATVPAGKIR